jgi:N-methylhydantoinase A
MSESPSAPSLRVAVDIGGTFTDGVATLSPEGRIWVAKSPTTPSDPGEAVSTVIKDLLRQVNGAAPSKTELSEVVHGTTLITNTLIERKGAETALVTTKGMGTALDIGREWRYDIYDLDIEMPKPLIGANRRVEIDERLGADGQVVTPLDDKMLDEVVEAIRGLKVSSVAISLLHAYINTDHEKKIGARLRKDLPSVAVSLSADLAREIKEYERTSTVAANAYVKPIVTRYLHELEARIAAIADNVPLRVMVSSGGFTSAASGAESPILLLESGPAAGVLSALNTARQNGVAHVLAFDMGGTTAKACVAVDGDPPIAHQFECARVSRFKRGSGLPILIPSIELIEIGAGGGSIAHSNRLGLLNIGPESAGSEPGPVCYGRGGSQPTVTDADLLLGYLDANNFLGGEMRLDAAAARNAVDALALDMKISSDELVRGISNIVNENMASAARIHIAENGYDPRDFTMVATGGAGPVHAVEVARKLRIPRVLIPIAAGAGSCLGMLAAPARVDRAWSSPGLLKDVQWPDISATFSAMRVEGEVELAAVGVTNVEWTMHAEIRYLGQGTQVSVAIPYQNVSEATGYKLAAAFEAQYEKLYGRLVPNSPLQVITWRLVGRAPADGQKFIWGDDRVSKQTALTGSRQIYLPIKGAFAEVPVYDRYAVRAGEILHGPLILEERESTIVVALTAEVEICPDLTVSVAIKEFD